MSSAPLEFQIMPLMQPNPDGIPIHLESIRMMCAAGLSECPDEDRAMAWLALLHIYPTNPNLWNEEKNKIVQAYQDFVNDVCHISDWHTFYFPNNVQKEQFPIEDKRIMQIIHGDIMRTGRHICFFPLDDESRYTGEGNPEDMLLPFSQHMRRLERILYVFATMNKALGYMQGFNELISPFYFALCRAKALFDDDLMAVEALSLQCLQQLLTTDIADFFTTVDQSSLILHKLDDFTKLARKHSPNEIELLEKLDLHPLQWCYRWFNLLFSQEYDLPNILIIWDSLLAHFDNITDFSFYIGIAQIHAISHKLDNQDFTISIDVLQNLRITNVYPILKDANQMYLEDHPRTITPTSKPKFHMFKRKK